MEETRERGLVNPETKASGMGQGAAAADAETGSTTGSGSGSGTGAATERLGEGTSHFEQVLILWVKHSLTSLHE